MVSILVRSCRPKQNCRTLCSIKPRNGTMLVHSSCDTLCRMCNPSPTAPLWPQTLPRTGFQILGWATCLMHHVGNLVPQVSKQNHQVTYRELYKTFMRKPRGRVLRCLALSKHRSVLEHLATCCAPKIQAPVPKAPKS